ncbi:hypothetical protein Y1Q_0013118 [Alligator mississippiensis]|uniref:Uncharacterized protein n=1 Tax=Alligator mississippiensis TaxID=8496 RepID=A0A151NH47_ALLMI|nr:hypothetical protein Y1Q_0013118 [Alligator mississippiensis]
MAAGSLLRCKGTEETVSTKWDGTAENNSWRKFALFLVQFCAFAKCLFQHGFLCNPCTPTDVSSSPNWKVVVAGYRWNEVRKSHLTEEKLCESMWTGQPSRMLQALHGFPEPAAIAIPMLLHRRAETACFLQGRG